MCQLVGHIFLLLLMTCFGNLEVTTNRESNTDVNVKSKASSTKFIKIPKQFHLKVSSPTFHTTNKTPTVTSTVSNATTPNLHKLSKKAAHNPTIRTGTLNSLSFETHTLNFAMLNPYIPERAPHPTLKKKTIDDQIYDTNLEKWLKDTNVNYSLANVTYADTRRSYMNGLHDYKNLIGKYKEESKKRSEKYTDEDIIVNDKYVLDALRVHEPVPPNFEDSFADTAAKRLHEIQSKHLKLKADEQALKSARRTYSSEYEDDPTTKTPNSIDRILALMDQFLMQAQQKLINGQLLKIKYKVYVKYKIGYTISLLRILKQQQLRLYSSMHFYRFKTPIVKGTRYTTELISVEYYLSLYEKIARLDDDVITLVNYIWDLEKERKIEEAIEATKFPKRNKYTPNLVVDFFRYMTKRPYP